MNILLNKNDKYESEIKQPSVKITVTSPTLKTSPHLDEITMEPIRKAIWNPSLSPNNIKIPFGRSVNCETGYLVNHARSCSCELCKNPLCHLVLFQMGVIHFRCRYLNGDCITQEEFFRDAFKWWNKLQNPYLQHLFRDIYLWMLMYYINAFRRVKNYDKALEMCDISLNYYKENSGKLDVAHYQSALEQKTSIEYIMKINQNGAESSAFKSVEEQNDSPLLNAKKILQYSPTEIVSSQGSNMKCEKNSDSKSTKIGKNAVKVKELLDGGRVEYVSRPEISKRGNRLQKCEKNTRRNELKNEENGESSQQEECTSQKTGKNVKAREQVDYKSDNSEPLARRKQRKCTVEEVKITRSRRRRI